MSVWQSNHVGVQRFSETGPSTLTAPGMREYGNIQTNDTEL
jgi:hypothetical protein